MPEDDPDAVAGLLEYLYTMRYPSALREQILRDLNMKSPADGSDYKAWGIVYWTFDLAMFKIAHKYDVQYLQEQALHHLDLRCKYDPMPSLSGDFGGKSFAQILQGYTQLVQDLYDEDLALLLKPSLDELLKHTFNHVASHFDAAEVDVLVHGELDFSKRVVAHLLDQTKQTKKAYDECSKQKMTWQGMYTATWSELELSRSEVKKKQDIINASTASKGRGRN